MSLPPVMSPVALWRALAGVLMTAGMMSTAQAMPMATTDYSEQQAAIQASAEFPLRYAVGLAPSLTAIDLNGGGVTIFSPGASSIGLRIGLQNWRADLPLQWESEALEHAHQIGPGNERTLWLPDVPGEMATLRWPTEDLPGSAQLTLELVYHGYRNVYGAQPKAAGDAGSCHVDIACPDANSWNGPARSTVLITVGNGLSRSLCSGALLNNTANDGRPLLITARHCGVTSSNAASLNAVFNFQRSVCNGANDGNDLRDVIRGANWLGESSRADTTLLALRSAIPASFGAQLGAWSAVAAVPASGASIHHPAGDQKKISLFNSPANSQNNVRIGSGSLLRPGGFNVDAWRVQWDRGVTEGGSSGSGLWNQNRALVGVLSGGSSSCSTPNGGDFYGRLHVAWDQSAAIRNALDPVNGGTSRSSSATAVTNNGTAAIDVGGGNPNALMLLFFAAMALLRCRGRRHH